MATPHTVGLFIPFDLNRKITLGEKQNQFIQGRRVNSYGELLVCDFDTVIRMNTSFLEVVDKFTPTKGGVVGPMLCISLFIFTLVLMFYFNAYFSLEYKAGMVGLIISGMTLVPCWFIFFRPVLKELFQKTHYPVRFNRRNKLVHVYQVNSEVITLPWNNIYFTTNKQKFSYCIVGHILAEDNETVLNTFSFGHVGSRQELALYWEFIRCYMEEDCVKELAETIQYCPPVEHKKEGYITGLQTLMKVDSRLEFIFSLLLIPLTLIESIGRYIAMQTSKIPQWPQEVLDACQTDSGDVIDVSAAINSPHQWRRVLANESEAEINEVNRRLKSASRRIREKLDARYGQV